MIVFLLQSSELSLDGLATRPSIRSSASSGFDETLDSPGSTSWAPLLGADRRFLALADQMVTSRNQYGRLQAMTISHHI